MFGIRYNNIFMVKYEGKEYRVSLLTSKTIL
jgi:hypothetical protein